MCDCRVVRLELARTGGRCAVQRRKAQPSHQSISLSPWAEQYSSILSFRECILQCFVYSCAHCMEPLTSSKFALAQSWAAWVRCCRQWTLPQPLQVNGRKSKPRGRARNNEGAHEIGVRRESTRRERKKSEVFWVPGYFIFLALRSSQAPYNGLYTHRFFVDHRFILRSFIPLRAIQQCHIGVVETSLWGIRLFPTVDNLTDTRVGPFGRGGLL